MKNSNSILKKLSSRKFWAALVGAATTVCALFGIDEPTTEQIVALVSSCGVLVAYIIAETCIDMKKRESNDGDSASDAFEDGEKTGAPTDVYSGGSHNG